MVAAIQHMRSNPCNPLQLCARCVHQPPCSSQCVVQSRTCSGLTFASLFCASNLCSRHSLLQVATLDEVYLFDLLALKRYQDVLNKAAHKVMQSAHVTKVGVELQNDLKKVYEGYPKLTAFSSVAAAVDIR